MDIINNLLEDFLFIHVSQEFSDGLKREYNDCIGVETPWAESTDLEFPSATFQENRLILIGWNIIKDRVSSMLGLFLKLRSFGVRVKLSLRKLTIIK